jgi:type IV secretion system protein VirB1
MTEITVAAALSLAIQCAPALDPHILVGIGQQESRLDPLALHINRMPPGWLQPHPRTAAEAARIARQFVSTGFDVDLGLMQVNSHSLTMLGLDLADAFDPCRSLSAAAKLLSLFAMYNTGSPGKGIANGYAPSVAARIHALKAAAGTETDPPVRLPVACPELDPAGWHAMAPPPGCQPTGDSAWHVIPHERDASR